jgi:anti-anti-sigma factor
MAPLFFSRLKAQSIQSTFVNGYQVFKIKEDLALGADFGALTDLVERAIKKGRVKVALHFTPRSYLYTPTVARLVEYYQLLQQHGGSLCIVRPNDEIVEVLEVIGLTKLVRIVSSEEEL